MYKINKIMITIEEGKYDEDYFCKMSYAEFNDYIKSFRTYEDFLKKEKIPYISQEIFNNWYHTICAMDIDTSNTKSIVHRFIKTSVTFDGVKYSDNTIKELIKNYQKYKQDEYRRIYKEFRNLTVNFNK